MNSSSIRPPLVFMQDSIPPNLAFQLAWKRDLNFSVARTVKTQPPYTAIESLRWLTAEEGIESEVVLEWDGHVVFAVMGDGYLRFRIWADTVQGAREAAERFQAECIPPWRDPSEGFVKIGFWSMSKFGPEVRWRTLSSADPAEVSRNYAPAVAAQVEMLLATKEPQSMGRLVLLHGPAGTGKTFCIRMLAERWKAWCETYYIVDPEVMLNNAAYLMQLVLGQTGEEAPVALPGSPPPERAREKWKLLVIEDASEFIERDAKERTGQGLARLLNVADGLIGQGTNSLVLITTNEPIERLHGAITRAGRCLANIEFPLLPREQANEWLESHGLDRRVSAATALAELYEMLGTSRIQTEKGSAARKMGFVA